MQPGPRGIDLFYNFFTGYDTGAGIEMSLGNSATGRSGFPIFFLSGTRASSFELGNWAPGPRHLDHWPVWIFGPSHDPKEEGLNPGRKDFGFPLASQVNRASPGSARQPIQRARSFQKSPPPQLLGPHLSKTPTQTSYKFSSYRPLPPTLPRYACAPGP